MKTKKSWAGHEEKALTAAGLQKLLKGGAAFVRVPGVLTPAQCKAVVERLRAQNVEKRSYKTCKTIELGPSVLNQDPKASLDGFRKKAAATAPAIRSLFKGAADPAEKIESMLKALGYKRETLDKDLGASPDMVGAFEPGSTATPYCDALPGRAGLTPARYDALLSWDVFLSDPKPGGELVVYALAGQGETPPAALADAAGASYAPSAGDGVLFVAGNWHEVKKNGALRALCHSFVALSTKRKAFALFP